MGLPHSKVVRVTCYSVSRTIKIPLFEPVIEEPEPKKIANDSRVPEELRPTGTTSVTVEEIHDLQNGAIDAAKAALASVEPKKVEVANRGTVSTPVLPSNL